MSNVLLSFGHGYSAQALAARLLAEGWRVIGTTRAADKARAIRATGAEAVLWPPADPAALLEPRDAPPRLGRARTPRATRCCGTAAQAIRGRARRASPGRAISRRPPSMATAAAAEVDERSECRPSTERGRWRLDAERAWAATGLPLHVFRLAGIYGPGRGPFEKLRAGRAQRVDQTRARCSAASMSRTSPRCCRLDRPAGAGPYPAIYNVCDDEAAPPEDVIAHAARLLGLPVPPAVPFEQAELSPMARSFYAESKRVSNRRIREELGVRLRYPTYREGLAALLETGRTRQPRLSPPPPRRGARADAGRPARGWGRRLRAGVVHPRLARLHARPGAVEAQLGQPATAGHGEQRAGRLAVGRDRRAGRGLARRRRPAPGPLRSVALCFIRAVTSWPT